jgi:hypothetical protein
MPVRLPNNPLNEVALLNTLSSIFAPNTQLAAGSLSNTGLECFFIQQKYAMSLGTFPAVLLSSGEQRVTRNSTSTYAGTHTVLVDYCDRWDRQSGLLIDTIRLDIAQDLERMKANLESYIDAHAGVTVNAVTYPLGIVRTQLSGYSKAIDREAIMGFAIGFRRLTILFTLLPYAV